MTRMAIAGVALAIAGCGPSAEERAAASAARPSAATVLVALQPEDGGALAGELRCGFARNDGEILLLAAADVGDDARASGVVRNARGAVSLTSEATGGFGALERGTTLAGDGLELVVTPGTEAATGSEERRFAATLTARSPDGAERIHRGTWTCGP